MHTQPNSRLTPIGRERLLRRHIEKGIPLVDLAVRAEISLRPPTSGSPGSAKAAQQHWWIDVACASPSGGRSIHSNSSAL
jgi:hypothetical protein